MKLKTVLTAFALCFASTAMPAIAQDVDREKAKEQMEASVMEAMDRLKLTDEQKPQFAVIMKNSAEQRKEVMDRYGIKEGEKPNLGLRQLRSMRDEMEGIRESTYQKMSGVLTGEQLAEFRKIQDEMREEMRARMRARR